MSSQSYYSSEAESSSPEVGEELWNQLYHFKESGQSERVVDVGLKLLSFYPESVYVYQSIGAAHTDLGNYDKAQEFIDKSIALAPDAAVGFQMRARLEVMRGRAGVADDYIRKALQLDPEDSFSWYALGALCIDYEDYEQARVCLDKVMQLDPEGVLGVKLRAMIQSSDENGQKDTPEQQIRNYTEVLESKPEDDYTYYRVASIYYDELKRYDLAEEAIKKAIAIDPMDEDYKNLYLKVVRKKDLFHRMLWRSFAPIEFLYKRYAVLWEKKWPILFLIFGLKYAVLLFATWVNLFVVFIWPVIKMYEYYTLRDVHRKVGIVRMYNGVFERVHLWSRMVRLFLFAGSVLMFYGLLFVLLPFVLGDFSKLKMWFDDFYEVLIGVVFVGLIVLGFFLLRDHLRSKAQKRKNSKLNESV